MKIEAHHLVKLRTDAERLLEWANATDLYTSEDDRYFIGLFLKGKYGVNYKELADVRSVVDFWSLQSKA